MYKVYIPLVEKYTPLVEKFLVVKLYHTKHEQEGERICV